MFLTKLVKITDNYAWAQLWQPVADDVCASNKYELKKQQSSSTDLVTIAVSYS